MTDKDKKVRELAERLRDEYLKPGNGMINQAIYILKHYTPKKRKKEER